MSGGQQRDEHLLDDRFLSDHGFADHGAQLPDQIGGALGLLGIFRRHVSSCSSWDSVGGRCSLRRARSSVIRVRTRPAGPLKSGFNRASWTGCAVSPPSLATWAASSAASEAGESPRRLAAAAASALRLASHSAAPPP